MQAAFSNLNAHMLQASTTNLATNLTTNSSTKAYAALLPSNAYSAPTMFNAKIKEECISIKIQDTGGHCGSRKGLTI
jgi:hypothetical protein